MSNHITALLNLEDHQIQSIHESIIDQVHHIDLTLKPDAQFCPYCGHNHLLIHGYHTRHINHSAYHHIPCIIHFKQRRYRCAHCLKTFKQHAPFIRSRQKQSTLTQLTLMNHLANPALSFQAIAKLAHTSDSTVIRQFQTMYQPPRVTIPRVLCLDEIYLGRKAIKKYAAVLLNFETNTVIDIIYGRSKNDLISYFQKHFMKQNQLEIVCTDMVDTFKLSLESYNPNITFCVDSFHVISLINTALKTAILKELNTWDKNSLEYYLLKHDRYLLLKNRNKIDMSARHYHRKLHYTITNHKLYQIILESFPNLAQLYEIKEAYLEFNRNSNTYQAQEHIDGIIQLFLSSTNHDYKRVGRTLSKWKKEIINSFIRVHGRRISNGPIENRNRMIKQVLSSGIGYSNFELLRARILYIFESKKQEKTR